MREIRRILTARDIKEYRALLSLCNLRDAESAYVIGLFKEDGELAACGAADGPIIKNVATSPLERETGAINQIVTDLIYKINEDGYSNAFVFTKPQNKAIFLSLGFNSIAMTSEVLLMERSNKGIAGFLEDCPHGDGAIVMNANPFTNGHLKLVEEAASRCRHLVVFLVEEDVSIFSTDERMQMASLALKQSRIKISGLVKGGQYIISMATFPTYFLKKADEANNEYSKLDATIFAERIAPELGIRTRFVGTEPLDMATAQYNSNLRTILADHGIDLVEIPRLESQGKVISGSQVREFLAKDDLHSVAPLVPRSTYRYLYALKLADLAGRSLIKEVEVTPKPGLVDMEHNGSHDDMDISTFRTSAAAIMPYFKQIAVFAINSMMIETPSTLPQEIRQIGIKAEAAMMQATGGINAHKGAIFSLGTLLFCCSMALNQDKAVNTENIMELCRKCMRDEMDTMKSSTSLTHGEKVFARYNVGGVRMQASSGYPDAVAALQFFRKLKQSMNENDALAWTTVYLISRLDDTNIYSRSDLDTALWARKEAAESLKHIDEGISVIRNLDKKFVSKNLSPGGSADLIALVWFLNQVDKLS